MRVNVADYHPDMGEIMEDGAPQKRATPVKKKVAAKKEESNEE